MELAATIFTGILVITAIVGAYFAVRNLSVIREQNRRNTFLALLTELAQPETRANREKVYQSLKIESDLNQIALITGIIEHGRESGREDPEKTLQIAIESTISCMDRIGFFLQHGGDEKLKEEAPDWIWDITIDIWDRVGSYVSHIQKTKPSHGKYFRELAELAKIKLPRKAEQVSTM